MRRYIYIHTYICYHCTNHLARIQKRNIYLCLTSILKSLFDQLPVSGSVWVTIRKAVGLRFFAGGSPLLSSKSRLDMLELKWFQAQVCLDLNNCQLGPTLWRLKN